MEVKSTALVFLCLTSLVSHLWVRPCHQWQFPASCLSNTPRVRVPRWPLCLGFGKCRCCACIFQLVFFISWLHTQEWHCWAGCVAALAVMSEELPHRFHRGRTHGQCRPGGRRFPSPEFLPTLVIADFAVTAILTGERWHLTVGLTCISWQWRVEHVSSTQRQEWTPGRRQPR